MKLSKEQKNALIGLPSHEKKAVETMVEIGVDKPSKKCLMDCQAFGYCLVGVYVEQILSGRFEDTDTTLDLFTSMHDFNQKIQDCPGRDKFIKASNVFSRIN